MEYENKNQFRTIPTAVKKKENIVVDGTCIDDSGTGTVLGLKLGRTGIQSHIINIIKNGKMALTELNRFRNLTTKIIVHLVRAFVIPIILYPPAPLLTEQNKCDQTTSNSK